MAKPSEVEDKIRALVRAMLRADRRQRWTLPRVEQALLEECLRQFVDAAGGNVSEAAERLGMVRSTMYVRMARAGELTPGMRAREARRAGRPS